MKKYFQPKYQRYLLQYTGLKMYQQTEAIEPGINR